MSDLRLTLGPEILTMQVLISGEIFSNCSYRTGGHRELLLIAITGLHICRGKRGVGRHAVDLIVIRIKEEILMTLRTD